MAERLVRKTRKGYAGDILALCTPGESWSPRFKNEAIRDIENNVHNYFIEKAGNKIAIVVSVKRGSKCLTTENLNSLINILGELENC